MGPIPLLLAVLSYGDDAPAHREIPADPLLACVRAEDRERFLRGLGEAEEFRVQLLTREVDGETRARRLGETIALFRERAASRLVDRPGLGHFALDPGELETRIRGAGRRVDPGAAFAPFAGRWYGFWEANRVDHDWSGVVVHDPPRAGLPLATLRIRATQSAWIGDGFGWNVVVTTDSGGDVILGTVYHVEEGHPDRVRLHRPHVGVDAGPGRLIWITAGEVFLEEVVSADRVEGAHYAITGFRYVLRDGKIAPVGEGFQAVYTRDPARRPAWHRFPVDWSLISPHSNPHPESS